MRKTLSIVLMLLGVGAFIYGNYLSSEANLGEDRVAQAQQQLDEHRQPLVGPIRKNISAQKTVAAQKKLGEKEQKIGEAQVTAHWIQGGGVVLFVVGLGCFIFSFRQKT